MPPSFQDLASAASARRAAGDFLAAAKIYRDAARRFPSSSAGLFVGICLRDAGDTEAALTALKAYTAHHPQDFDGWTTLGISLKALDRNADAATALQKALDLRNDPAARNTLVTALWRANRMAEAKAEGLVNLALKDDLALQTFMASPFRANRLSPDRKGFDPENRRRNVIAFSLWGDRPEYVTGAIVNAQIAPHLYMGWTPRFYCDTSVPADAREILQAYGAEVILMEQPAHRDIRPMWRFLASDDPEVNVFLCRDADSRLNAKELIAVQDWLRSGKPFHIMRDHIYHMELILAGMWGGQAGVLPPLGDWLAAAKREKVLTYFDNRFGDQAFLADMIWPLIRNAALIHDSVYGYPSARAFPDAYDLPGLVHVGGSVKAMPHWSTYPRAN
ncbi:tetratricopeptide repeat protein [Paracoccus aminophilus]|uniref:Uncharacterized protein n=1 Tax=Paracoccus aminophilus JCM 7686 TaxID=1367847 RepID=S5Z1B4_PARAH|nr:tetratricopeptide repeat protein [Paracoccus aminophilus]AGT11221.1 hypothetical protein JCM7686_pAMI5p155 [Paracoccus aminophilus JCM 7686]